MSKIYKGIQNDVALVNGVPLNPRNDLVNHSPTGFSWGYGGSGPAQLALAILADYYNDEFALDHYQKFKWKKIAGVQKGADWMITGKEIEDSFRCDQVGLKC